MQIGRRTNLIAALGGVVIVLTGAILGFHVLQATLHRTAPRATISHTSPTQAAIPKDVVVEDLASELLGAKFTPALGRIATTTLASTLAPKIRAAHDSAQAAQIQSHLSIASLKWASPTTAHLSVLLEVSTNTHPHIASETLHLVITVEHSYRGWKATGVSGA